MAITRFFPFFLLFFLFVTCCPQSSNCAPLSSSVAETVTILTQEKQDWLRANPVLRVAINDSFPPVEFLDDNGQPQGVAIDYLRHCETLVDIQFDFHLTGSRRATLDGLRSRIFDVSAAIQHTDQRKEFLDFTEPYLSMTVAVFSRGNHSYIIDLNQLNGQRVAVVDQSFIHTAIMADYPDIDLVPMVSAQQGLSALATGKVDALIDVLSFASYYITQLGLAQIGVVGETPYKRHFAMAVRNDQPLLSSIIKKALNSISQQERHRIARKWFAVQSERPFNYSLFWKTSIPLVAIIAFIVLWNRRLSKEIGLRKI